MSSSAQAPALPIAVLRLHRTSAPQFIAGARFIVQRMSESPWFPAPQPSLAVVEAAIDDLSDAQTTAQTRVKGSIAVRDQKRLALAMKLDQLRMYVQTIAWANPDSAVAIIESAGMHVKDARGRGKPVFRAKPGPLATEVVLEVPKVGLRPGFEFQVRPVGTPAWLALPEPFTTKASVTVRGLTPGATVEFRYRTNVKGVTGDWSDVITWIVGTR